MDPRMEAPLFAQSDSLRRVLEAAIRAPGNWSRFLESGLINQAGLLATDWQSAFLRIAPLTKAAVRDQPGQFLAQAVDVVFGVKQAVHQGSPSPILPESSGTKSDWQPDSIT